MKALLANRWITRGWRLCCCCCSSLLMLLMLLLILSLKMGPLLSSRWIWRGWRRDAEPWWSVWWPSRNSLWKSKSQHMMMIVVVWGPPETPRTIFDGSKGVELVPTCETQCSTLFNRCSTQIGLWPNIAKYGQKWLFFGHNCVTQLKLDTVEKLSSSIFCCLSVSQSVSEASVSPDQISTFSNIYRHTSTLLTQYNI